MKATDGLSEIKFMIVFVAQATLRDLAQKKWTPAAFHLGLSGIYILKLIM